MSRRSSQAYWTEAEALERAGKKREAVDLYVRAASLEDKSRPMHARHLWEQIADKFGTTPTLLERLASSSERAELVDDAFHYWLAAALSYRQQQKERDSAFTADRARKLQTRRSPSSVPPPHAQALIEPNAEWISEILLETEDGKEGDEGEAENS